MRRCRHLPGHQLMKARITGKLGRFSSKWAATRDPLMIGQTLHCWPQKASVRQAASKNSGRSEEHTSELQSHSDLVCRLLLEKKKTRKKTTQRSRKSNR